MLADIVWPGAALVMGTFSFLPMALGLLIEWPFVTWIVKVNGWKGLLATAFINFVSAIVGAVLIGMTTLMMDMSFLLLFEKYSNAISLTLTFLVAWLMTTAIEVLALTIYCETRWFEKTGLPMPPLSRI
jgi:uncharacterized membrane protein YhdT